MRKVLFFALAVLALATVCGSSQAGPLKRLHDRRQGGCTTCTQTQSFQSSQSFQFRGAACPVGGCPAGTCATGSCAAGCAAGQCPTGSCATGKCAVPPASAGGPRR